MSKYYTYIIMEILKIPQSVQEILDVFIKSNFRRFSYKYLADQLGLKVDTVIQRISRNKEFFAIDDNERPSRISIRKGIDVSEKNICQNPKCCNRDTKDRWNKKKAKQ